MKRANDLQSGSRSALPEDPLKALLPTMRSWFHLMLLLVIPAVSCRESVVHAAAADLPGVLRWHVQERRVDADIRNWPLDHTLRRIAAATGWEVRMEPGLEARVGAKFEDRPERQALAMLLGDLSFALVPGSNSAPRLLVFRSSSSQATQALEPSEQSETGSRRLLHEVIVRLKPGSSVDIHELAARLGGRVAGKVASLNAYRLVFEDAASAEAARRALSELDSVARMESNYSLERPPPVEASEPGIVRSSLKAKSVDDSGAVVVALLDTAVATDGVEHRDFLLPGLTMQDGNIEIGEVPSHGSTMFETIIQGLSVTQTGEDGIAVRVLPVDIYGDSPETSTFQLAQGIAAALEAGAHILNLSLSGPVPSPVVEDLLRQAAAAGVLTFAAPGNEPTTAPTFPAAYPEVVAVTAGDRNGQVAPYANRGGFIDLIAPGTSVVPYLGETWRVHGTSVATAYASGLAAGLLSTPGRSPADVLAELRHKLAFAPPVAPDAAP